MDSIGVDLTACAYSNENLLFHDLLGGVGRQVDLEEAGVRLWEMSVSSAVRGDLMPPTRSRIGGQLGSAIDELEVLLLVIFIHLVEHLPEPVNDLLRVIAFVVGILPQDVHVNEWLTHSSDLSIAPGEVLAARLGGDVVDAAQEMLHLDRCLLQDFH